MQCYVAQSMALINNAVSELNMQKVLQKMFQTYLRIFWVEIFSTDFLTDYSCTNVVLRDTVVNFNLLKTSKDCCDVRKFLGTWYTLDLFMHIKNNATRKAVKTIILTFRLR